MGKKGGQKGRGGKENMREQNSHDGERTERESK